MGLDMYLRETHYFSKYDRDGGERRNAILEAAGIAPWNDNIGSTQVSHEVMYWRKANAIHGWFVDNCADGVDNCRPVEVEDDDLRTLIDLCERALAGEEEARAALKPTAGFFFGATDDEEWYRNDLEHTIEGLTRVLKNKGDGSWFVYEASW